MAKALNTLGMPTAAVHSESPRDKSISDFKSGKLRALTNVNVLTTGFNFPAIDMIVMVRPTKSMGLHQQMLGRGMRTHPSKTVTVIKDFTNNTQSLGTVERPAPIQEKITGKGGTNPFMKMCPTCDAICYPAVRVCKCGFEFKFEHNLKKEAYTRESLPKWYEVERVYYNIHYKVGSPDSVKVTYVCGVRQFAQWILIEHPGYAGHQARHWVQKRFKGNVPSTARELYLVSASIKAPKRIQVEEKGKYPKILSVV
jgi:DNA repair protein RadD